MLFQRTAENFVRNFHLNELISYTNLISMEKATKLEKVRATHSDLSLNYNYFWLKILLNVVVVEARRVRWSLNCKTISPSLLDKKMIDAGVFFLQCLKVSYLTRWNLHKSVLNSNDLWYCEEQTPHWGMSALPYLRPCRTWADSSSVCHP